jgi:hypothetical protein
MSLLQVALQNREYQIIRYLVENGVSMDLDSKNLREYYVPQAICGSEEVDWNSTTPILPYLVEVIGLNVNAESTMNLIDTSIATMLRPAGEDPTSRRWIPTTYTANSLLQYHNSYSGKYDYATHKTLSYLLNHTGINCCPGLVQD